jgi:hypothetical protein
MMKQGKVFLKLFQTISKAPLDLNKKIKIMQKIVLVRTDILQSIKIKLQD